MPARVSWVEHMRMTWPNTPHFAYYSSYGTRMAISSTYDHREYMTLFLDLESKVEVQRIRYKRASHHVAVSPDGSILAVTNDGYGVLLYDIHSGHRIGDFAEHQPIGGMDFFPNGTSMAIWDGYGLSLWNVPSGQRTKFVEVRSSVMDVTVSPLGSYIATIDPDHTVSLWDSYTLERAYILRGHTDYVQSVQFTPYEETCITGSSDGSIRLWMPIGRRMHTTKELFAIKVFYEHNLSGVKNWKASINYTSFSPQHSLFAVGAVDGTVRLIDFQTWREVQALSLGDRVWKVKFSPCGRYLAAYDDDNTLVVWKSN